MGKYSGRWGYRCTVEGVAKLPTKTFLDRDHFCWRSVFTHASAGPSGLPPVIANVRHVRISDSLYVYFSEGGIDELLGIYLVTSSPERVEDSIGVSAIGVVDDDELKGRLADEGYQTDPYLGVFTGFFVKRDPYGIALKQAPSFRGQNALVALP